MDTSTISQCELAFEQAVASGCTANVFKGKFCGKAVAIKKMLPVVADDEVLQKAFFREVEVMSVVKHRNLVQMFGVVEEPACIVMEFCAGASLFTLLHESDLDVMWHQQLKMVVDIAEAMGYLHSLDPQIMHRDLKSLNCLLAEPVLTPRDVPLVKVADFGLSRKWELNQKMTQACGTSHWMAPEVALGTEYDTSADVFSYGMMLWEILCLEIPFEDLSAQQVGVMLSRGMRPVIQPGYFPPQCPREMIVLMRLCWDQSPSRRPCFEEVKIALRSLEARDN